MPKDFYIEPAPGETIDPIKLPKKLIKLMGKAILDFRMISEGDHILVACSGGKDSSMMAHAFAYFKRHAPIQFTFQCATITYGMGEDYSLQHNHFLKYKIPHEIFDTEIFELSKTKMNPDSSFCSFFSRLRRGNLVAAAKHFGCNKIALGHHLDDAAESLFMSLMYNGALRSMSPHYTAESGEVIIRPLCYVRETTLASGAIENNIPTVGNEMCPGMVLPQARMPHARAEVKELLRNIEKTVPHFYDSVRHALGNVQPETFFIKPPIFSKE